MADVLWQDSTTGWTAIWLMNGTTVNSAQSSGLVSDANWEVKGLGDLNGNGKADVLWWYATSGLTAVWLMDGATITLVASPGLVSDLNWQIMNNKPF
jgi:hypothetical protein